MVITFNDSYLRFMVSVKIHNIKNMYPDLNRTTKYNCLGNENTQTLHNTHKKVLQPTVEAAISKHEHNHLFVFTLSDKHINI